MDITGKVAIVTGAGSGIGRATAVALADAGAAAVVAADIDEVGGEQTARDAEKRGAKSIFVSTDVSNVDQVAALFERAETEFGGVDLVHNNAGINAGTPDWPATPLSKVTKVIGINLLGVFYGIRIGIDHLSKRGGGAIVNTASVAAFGPMVPDPMYSASKIGIVNVTQACAGLRESHNIRVNCILPGITRTNILNVTGDGTKPAVWLQPVLEIVNLLDPEDIAAGVLDLMRDDGLSGAALVVTNPPEKGGAPVRTVLANPVEFDRHMTDQAEFMAQQMAAMAEHAGEKG